MKATKRAKIKEGWVVCWNCTHKLGKVLDGCKPKGLEIKCSSCKELNIIDKCKEWKPPKIQVKQYKMPHYRHCEWYKEYTGTCMAILRQKGLKSKSMCKPVSCSKCDVFKPKKEYEENYKEFKEKI